MHETGIVRGLVRHLDALAQDAGAIAIDRVHVSLGALSQFSPAHFREHFEEEIEGTIAQGAQLEIEEASDPADPDALHVVIRSVDLDIPDDAS
ncbi:hypothetical protein GCM10023115_20510 [Pontixanthobacter gangjinensis]|uniref:Hydrogenase maturation nickel metallochaperone HypA n=1 Tax=Pontixanthobacter gangjinensis TaxID=1028742 RepID=A0A6I4SNT4_9SPHN|nr:hydrogenase maturation nickel metallochaperone HypA [Pontixanthobacter gangjinensis]MXO57299.1 hydrogenase maturation nickel metallochaperone HypA [Pontixanthobacter gangjinensis]